MKKQKPQRFWNEEEEKIMNKIWIIFPEEAKKMLERTDQSISGKANCMGIYKMPSRYRSIIKKRLGKDLEEVIESR